MKTYTRVFGFLTVIATLLTSYMKSADAGFFPLRREGIALHSVRGILMEFASGQGVGGFDIKEGGHILHFIAGQSIKINGQIIHCTNPAFEKCAHWPSNLSLQHSVVEVHYWIITHSEEQVGPLPASEEHPYKISDQIDLITP